MKKLYTNLIVVAIAILSFSLVSCSSSSSPAKDVHTLVYAAGPLGTVRDDGCIVLYMYSSGNLIWGDIPESHAEVETQLRAERDFYKYAAASDFLDNPLGAHFFYPTGEHVDGYKIYENDSSMRIGITEERSTLYFESSGARSSIVLELVGKVNP